MHNLVILISGSGSNMQAIVRYAAAQEWDRKFEARIAAVISNKADASGLMFAKAMNIDTHVVEHQLYPTRSQFDTALKKVLAPYQPSLIVLAGFMRVLGSEFVNEFSKKIINIHPSLLPAFTGLHTHQRVIDSGCRFTGATVHRVTPVLDEGQILAQAVVPVLSSDNASTLAARVLSQEHLIYPAAIERLLCTLNNS